MSLGSAKQLDTLDELLGAADFLSLHVPELPETTNMIGTAEIAKMKDGSYLLNNARGKVIDIPALVAALQSGHLAGAAVDVFPSEPAKNGPHFSDELNGWASALRACPNLILTPHIGGSTEEAQRMIGAEVASALLRYVNYGSTVGAVNFPEVNLRPILHEGTVRLCHVHLNQPGVLKIVNSILGEHNVEKQFSVGPSFSLLAELFSLTHGYRTPRATSPTSLPTSSMSTSGKSRRSTMRSPRPGPTSRPGTLPRISLIESPLLTSRSSRVLF